MSSLKDFTLYNKWANSLLLNLILSEIDEAMLDREIISSFPSLRKTVYHLWDAEFIWLRRLKGESLNDWPGKSFKGNFSEACKKITEVDSEFIELAESLNENDLLQPFTYRNIEGKEFTNPVWQSVLHCMNHSTYHRGQIVTMLRQMGISKIPATDFIAFCRL